MSTTVLNCAVRVRVNLGRLVFLRHCSNYAELEELLGAGIPGWVFVETDTCTIAFGWGWNAEKPRLKSIQPHGDESWRFEDDRGRITGVFFRRDHDSALLTFQQPNYDAPDPYVI